MITRISVLFFIASAFILPLLHAQEDSLSQKMSKLGINELIEGRVLTDDKIVGASRSARKLEDLPMTVHVITADEILKNGYTTLVDALKMVPGVRTAKVGNAQSGEQFLLRGLDGNVYTKILLNSLPIQPSSDGTLGINEQLPISQVERIEVIYGASSALYGADAMAGVINIITKTGQNSNFTQMNIHTGQFGYRHVNFFAGGKLGKDRNIVQYQIMGNWGSRDDINVRNPAYDKIYSFLEENPGFAGKSEAEIRAYLDSDEGKALKYNLAISSPYYNGDLLNPEIGKLPQKSYMYGANVRYRNLNFSFYEMYREEHTSLGRLPIYFAYDNPESKIGDKTQIYSFNYSFDIHKITFTTNAMYLRARYNPFSSYASTFHNFGRSYVFQASDDIFAEALVNYNLSKKIEITSGISYKRSGAMPLTRDFEMPFDTDIYKPFNNKVDLVDITFGDFGVTNKTISNLGAFLQAFYTAKRWNLIASLRFDAPSNYGAQVYQRLAAMFKLTPKTTFRASVGYAFKAPTLFTSYYGVAVADRNFDSLTLEYKEPTGLIVYQVIPNPFLKPEEAASIELGLRYKLADNAYFDVSAFSNVVSNRISAQVAPIPKHVFPLAVNDFARFYYNDANNKAALLGFQSTFRAVNLIPKLSLNLNLTYTLQGGGETIARKGETDFVREVPTHSFQAGISMMPFKKLYINADFVAFSSWYKRFLDETDLNDAQSLSYALVNGYSTLDLTARYYFGKTFSAFIKGTNIFDVPYGGINATGFDIDMRYTPQAGRNIHLGLSINMK